MKFTSAIATLLTVVVVAASDPRVLARTGDTFAIEKRGPQGLIGFQCHPWYKCCPPCASDLADAIEVLTRQAVAAPCEPGKFGCTEPPKEKRQICHPGHECKPPVEERQICHPGHECKPPVEQLEAETDTVEKRDGTIGVVCRPWMACWQHGPSEVIAQLEAKAGGVEKRQAPIIGFQCYPWMLCWPHVTEAEKQASA